MIDLQEMVSKTLNAHDASRARSRQVEVGPSGVGGCHRRLWHELAGTEHTNDGDKLGAICGTFIHTGIEQALRRQDPFGDIYELEIGVEYDGLRGNVDCYDKVNRMVIDWKTNKKGGARYFGKGNRQQIWQIQLYGWLLTQNGYVVEDVSLVGIPRDGKMKDILVHTEPYDPAIAQEALDHLNKTKQMVQIGEKPAPEKTLAFCADFCPFYDPSGEVGCPSTVK